MAARSNTNGLGIAIRALRKTAGLTLEDVSAIAGVSTNYLSRAENGLVEPSASWVEVVVTAMGDHMAAAEIQALSA
jgi:predicted transcriptional regulator